MHNLSQLEQIGQHFVCGFPSTYLDEAFKEAVRTYKIANVILFARNIESKQQLKDLCSEIQTLVREECHTSALICIDQEGGMVTRLSDDCTNVPGAMALSATNDEDAVFEAGTITAKELKALGVNCNLAPVLDVNSNKDNPVIGVRSFGDTQEQVSKFATKQMEALQVNGILAVGKHFPGHGDTHLDSHLALPKVEMDKLHLEEHIAPFRSAIRNGIQGIMSSHILFPSLEQQMLPATMSRAILTDFLKGELGFKGLVFSDCMEMQAIQKYYGTQAGSLSALISGVDLVCISHHVQLAIETIALVKEALQHGQLDRKEFAESTQKILLAKEMLEAEAPVPFEVVGGKDHTQRSQTLLERTFCMVNDVPFQFGDKALFVGPRLFSATNVSNADTSVVFSTGMAERLGGDSLITSENPNQNEIEKVLLEAELHTSVIVGTYNGHLYTGQVDLVNALAKTGVPVFCVALRNPYDLALLSEHVASLAVFEYTDKVLDALSRFFRGEIEATGKLPVRL